jgi:hypothetical protein
VDLRRFGVHRFERRLSEAKFRRTSGALAQPGAAADAVDRRRFSKASCPARLILVRWVLDDASHATNLTIQCSNKLVSTDPAFCQGVLTNYFLEEKNPCAH